MERLPHFTSTEKEHTDSKVTEARIARIMRDMHDGASFALARSASEAWSSNSIYKSDDYEFSLYAPEGQCGVTNFTLGIFLAWSGVVSIDNIYYEEGTIKGRDGTLSEHHAWIKVVDGDQSWKIDLTPHQYTDINPDPDASMHMVLQSTTNDWTGSYKNINQRHDTDIPIPNSYSLQYEAHTSTPLKEYDTTQFEGRLERFMGRIGAEPAMGAGPPMHSMPDSRFKYFWYPDNYDFSEEVAEKNSGDFLGELTLEEMLELIDKSKGSQYDKLTDIQRAYGNQIERLLEKADYSTLLTWAKDCVDHIMPYLKRRDPFRKDIQKLIKLFHNETIDWSKDASELLYSHSEVQLQKTLDSFNDPYEHYDKFDYYLWHTVNRLLQLKASIHINPYDPSLQDETVYDPIDCTRSIHHCIYTALKSLGRNDAEWLSELIWQTERLEELVRDRDEASLKDIPAPTRYHPAGEAIKVAEALHTHENNITELVDQATPEILMIWLGDCAKRAILQFLAEVPYDSILLKYIRREAEDDTWNRVDTIYEFGKYAYEHERLYQSSTATLAAHTAAVFYYVQEIEPAQREKHWPEIKRIILETAGFAAQAAVYNQETTLSERAWQFEHLNELIAHGPSSLKPFSPW